MLSTSVRDDASTCVWGAKEAQTERESLAYELVMFQLMVKDVNEAIGEDGKASLEEVKRMMEESQERIEEEHEEDIRIFAAFNKGNWAETWDDRKTEREPEQGKMDAHGNWHPLLKLRASPPMNPQGRRQCLECWPQLELLMMNHQEFLQSLYNSPQRAKYPHLEHLMQHAVRMGDDFIEVQALVQVTHDHIKDGLAKPEEFGRRRRLGRMEKTREFLVLLQDLDNRYYEEKWKKKVQEEDGEEYQPVDEVDVGIMKPSEMVEHAMRFMVLRTQPSRKYCKACERRLALVQASRARRVGGKKPKYERNKVLIDLLQTVSRDAPVTRGAWMDEVAIEYDAFEEDRYSQAGEIEAPPFGKKMREALMEGRKCMTSRYKPFGEVGNWFRMGPQKYMIAYIEPKLLREVFKNYYRMEGFETGQDMVQYWIEMHGDMFTCTNKQSKAMRAQGRRGWHMDDTVYVHVLMEPWDSTPIREFNSPVIKQDEYVASGMGEELLETARCVVAAEERQALYGAIENGLQAIVDAADGWEAVATAMGDAEHGLSKADRQFDHAVSRAHKQRNLAMDRVEDSKIEVSYNKERDYVNRVMRRLASEEEWKRLNPQLSIQS